MHKSVMECLIDDIKRLKGNISIKEDYYLLMINDLYKLSNITEYIIKKDINGINIYRYYLNYEEDIDYEISIDVNSYNVVLTLNKIRLGTKENPIESTTQFNLETGYINKNNHGLLLKK